MIDAIQGVKIPDSPCPTCGKTGGKTSPAAEHREPPKPGDISICYACESAGIYNADLTVRKPTIREQFDIASLPVTAAARAAVRMMKQKKEEPPTHA